MSRESKIITISATIHFLTHMSMLIFPAMVLPIAREMITTPSTIISIAFFMYLLYGGLALPAGFMADKWPRISILKICAAGISAASFLAGFSSTTAGLTAALALLGLFCGIYHPAGLGLIAHEIGKQGRAHGINGIFGNLGIAAAPLLAGAILMFANWRYVFFVTGAMGMAALLLVFLLEVRERKGHAPASGAPKDDSAHKAKYFTILLAVMTVVGLIYRANTMALPTLLETSSGGALADIITTVADRLGHDAGSGAAAIIVSSIFMFSVAGQAVGGKVADRTDLRHGYIFFHGMTAVFIALVGITSGIPLYFAAAGMVFFNLGMQPIENSLVSKFIPSRWISTGYGIKFTFTFGVGSLAVWQVAWAEQTIGLRNLYPILAAEAALATTLAFWLLAATRSLGEVRNSHSSRIAKITIDKTAAKIDN
ncbi:MAG: MFS transporter [Nitrospinota bacterium]|nr:MFS transporter [Nitrospinota bacterium]